MYCYKCGHELREGASYCSYCGVKVAENQDIETRQKDDNSEPLVGEAREVEDNSFESTNEDNDINQNEDTNQSPLKKCGSLLGSLFLMLVMVVIAKGFAKAFMGSFLEYAHSTPYRSMLFLNFGTGVFWGGILALVPWMLFKHYDENDEYAWGTKCIFAINISIGILGGLIFAIVGSAILTCIVWYALANHNK